MKRSQRIFSKRFVVTIGFKKPCFYTSIIEEKIELANLQRVNIKVKCERFNQHKNTPCGR